MPFVSQQVLSILDGVSQQPDKLRAIGEAEAQVNVFDSIVHGKMKRPPTTHVAKLFSTPLVRGTNTTPGAFIWPVNRDSSLRYHVVVNTEGTPQVLVFDATTGQQYPVLTPQGTSYLIPQTAPSFVGHFVSDSVFPGAYLDGTLLESTVSSNGQTWSQAPSLNPGSFANGPNSGMEISLQTGLPANWGLRGKLQNSSIIENAGAVLNLTPNSADYSISVTINPIELAGNAWGLQLMLRSNPVGNQQVAYLAGIMFGHYASGGGTTGSVGRVNSDTSFTQVGSSFTCPYGPGWFQGGVYTLTFSVVGTTLTVTYVSVDNGISLTTIFTGTDSAISAAGSPGLYFYDESANFSSPPGRASAVVQDLSVSYVEDVTIPTPLQYSIRFTQIQDTTFILNQSQTVEPLRTAASATPVRQPEALISIRQIDYGTNYNVVLNGVNFGFSTSAPTTVNAREQLTTDVLTQQLASQITSSTIGSQFVVEVFGSTIYLTRNDGTDFTITATDGLSDQAIVIVKGSVQSQTLLPGVAVEGFVALVQPDPDNKFDAAYYVYDNLGQPQQAGIWRECAKPGILTTLNNNTMPWSLTRLGNVVAGFPADGGPTALPAIAGTDLTTTTFAPSGTCIGDNGHFVTGTLPSAATGVTGQLVTVYFDVNLVQGPSCSTGNLPNNEYVTVQVTDSSQAGKTFSKVYYGGTNYPDESISFASPGTSGATITVTMFYSRQSTPPTDHQGNIYVHTTTDSPAGMAVLVPKATALTFPTQQTYPQGVTYTVAVSAPTAETHTLTPTTDLTAVTLASALAALSWVHYTATASDGVLTLTPVTGVVAPTVTFSTNWNESEQYHNGALELGVNALIGYQIQDLTDGSSGAVTSNTSTTITASAGLSGGVQNKFSNGDLVSVIGPEGSFYFIFQPVNWTPRGVGDDNTNPFPSFTYSNIAEIGYASNRLIFTSGENVICSGSGDLFDFFRTTVTQLLDADRIDVQGNSDMVSDWHSIVHWAEGTWLWAGNVQAQLPTVPALANSTISIQPQTSYQSAPTLRPLAMDRRVYFARERTGAFPVTQIFRYQRIRFPFQGFIAEEQTKKIPTYLQGSPLQLVGDPTLEIMVALTDAAPNQLYPYVFHYDESQQLQQESWSTWVLDPAATILSMDMLDGHLGLIVSRPDGVYLEDVDLQVALYDQL